jgi:single-stranded DNA-binding protein
MIDALICGRLYGAPVPRMTKANRPYCTAKVRVSARDGESLFVDVVCFSPAAVASLLALSEGDAVALAGELTPRAFTSKDGAPRPSLDLLAHVVTSEYHVGRKRKAVRDAQTSTPVELPFDDDLSGVA